MRIEVSSTYEVLSIIDAKESSSGRSIPDFFMVRKSLQCIFIHPRYGYIVEMQLKVGDHITKENYDLLMGALEWYNNSKEGIFNETE